MILTGEPTYCSPSATIWIARDIYAKNDVKTLALKVMSDEDQFINEVILVRLIYTVMVKSFDTEGEIPGWSNGRERRAVCSGLYYCASSCSSRLSFSTEERLSTNGGGRAI